MIAQSKKVIREINIIEQVQSHLQSIDTKLALLSVSIVALQNPREHDLVLELMLNASLCGNCVGIRYLALQRRLRGLELLFRRL